MPSAACWQLAAPPRAVSRAELARLMGGCDRDSAAGRRDLAILVLLARLGLRAGEVAALDLGDISRREGEITGAARPSPRILRLPAVIPAFKIHMSLTWAVTSRTVSLT